MSRLTVPEPTTYGRVREILDVPNLVDLQTSSYADFLQMDVPYGERRNVGLEAILREIFPIKSFNGEIALEYVGYELGRARYTPDECRRLRLTYGAPFKVRVRLDKEDAIEEEVYLGEVPLMLGGGEFIINGAERVIVTQLHRSPGVDFSVDIQTGERKLHSCWIIPERGSWIELNVSKKDILQVRIDQSGKFPCTSLLRALSEEYSTDADILRLFYKTTKVKGGSKTFRQQITGKRCTAEVVDPETGEILVDAMQVINDDLAGIIAQHKIPEVELIDEIDDPLILNTLADDTTANHEEALLKIYGRLRPGNPPNIEKARELFRDKFYDASRYRLGKVGRFRLNRKFGTDIPQTEQTLRPDDILNCIKYLMKLRRGDGEIDDIDHLGNRRIRSICELASDELRKGFLKLRRTVQERMNMDDPSKLAPRALINSKTISSAIDYFFGRGELSQVVDQTNPLSQLTHERRLSALGPGGLNRKRAGFEVRDVHISHYGRICPIETPEGTNIGLISSLAIYAKVDDYGFLVTPYRVVEKGRVTDEIRYLRADEESQAVLGPAATELDAKGKLVGDLILARREGDFVQVTPDEVEFLDVSPRQVVGVSAALVPFLEHDDANRALMGSNMMRQAVPLVWTDPPVVGTGMEQHVPRYSGMVIVAENSGTVSYVDANRILIDEKEYKLRKFVGLNERTCLNQQPCVKLGEKIEKGRVIADGGGTLQGELALGKNVLVAFMSWEGYNFEDAIIVSEALLKRDVYTSIHIEEFEIEIRETKLGREEFTRDIPNVSEKALRNLDETGVIRMGTRIKPGDVLVGKVAPKSKSELSPEEKLLHAIFGRAGEDVKNDSLEVPPGVDGIVIDAEKFTRKVNLTEEERQKNLAEIKRLERGFTSDLKDLMRECVEKVQTAFKGKLVDPATEQPFVMGDLNVNETRDLRERLKSAVIHAPDGAGKDRAWRVVIDIYDRIDALENDKNKRVNRLSRGDELQTGVLEMVRVYVATKRQLSVGDKMAGRHGNKGVVSKILPVEDMPYLDDGTPIDIILNPLGVPSRMNVGQILETHVGWAAKSLGKRVTTPVFDGCKEIEIEELLESAGLPRTGKTRLYDGRTGDPMDQEVTVGVIYMMKLHHLVDDKVHARATGPYSLITQQPLGGKARFGGQRFGEMEVWALEAYGAAYILQELLTVKSDDVDGRTKIYESMVKGENLLEAGTPVSFEVLCNEIKGLALNIEMERSAF